MTSTMWLTSIGQSNCEPPVSSALNSFVSSEAVIACSNWSFWHFSHSYYLATLKGKVSEGDVYTASAHRQSRDNNLTVSENFNVQAYYHT